MKKTPCEELGYKVGDRFMVIAGPDFHYLDNGTIVTLYEDDGTESPEFRVDSVMYSSNKYIHLEDIIPIYNTTILIPCPEGYEFDGIRRLNYGDFFLDNGEYVYEWTLEERSTRKYIALKKIKPETMTLTLERKGGKTISKGEYYTDGTSSNPVSWGLLEHTFEGNDTKIWRVVSVETNNS